jgi:hypothetical protein
VALGLIVVAFLALGAYDRGYDAAVRSFVRNELAARRRRAPSAATAAAA